MGTKAIMYRRVFKTGDSVGITLPHDLGIIAGENIKVIFEPKSGKATIEKVNGQ